jgi:nitrate/nitrite transporter NarK
LGLIAIVAPAVISFWFPPQKQGTPMGIWATWMPVGIILMLLIAPWLGLTTGWQSVWWFGAIFALVALVLYALLLRMPPGMAELDAAMETPPLRQALANRDIWFLGLAFCCFNWVFMPITTYYVTFLTEMRGFSLAGASQVVLLSTVAALISAPVSGLLSDRIGSRKRFLTIPFLLLAVMLLLPFRVEGWQIFVYMAIQGLVAGVVPPATFAAAPEVMSKPQLAGIGLAVVMLGQNLGMFVAPVIFGAMVEATSWTVAGLGLIPMALLGFFAARQVRVR